MNTEIEKELESVEYSVSTDEKEPDITSDSEKNTKPNDDELAVPD